ncbi:MAG: DNA cytosine methyltransferase [Clostridiales bacterium]|jgi:DNA (cytosine-5)-methyltransferase 1|nr:DNA cytosine methyltransferase [Clostridiales bacterium]
MKLAKRPIAIDLFCGAGGMSLGFEQAGFDVVSAVELDPVHAAVHGFNFPQCKTMRSDVSGISKSAFENALGSQASAGIDALFGGPPCQGFSVIGRRDENDQRNSLIHQFMRLVRELRPKYFVMENVAGLTIGYAKNLLDEAIAGIQASGYNVILPYRILDAKDFGIPQSRKRLFLIGCRNDQKLVEYPLPLAVSVTASDAIGDLPNIDLFEELMSSDCVGFEVKPLSDYARILHGDKADSQDFSYPRIWDPRILTGSLRTVHSEVSRARFAQTPLGKAEPISRFYKLDPDGICTALRAGTDKSKGAHTSARPIHYRDNRCISVREAERLHSYPDWFRMHSTKWHGFREVGNSVPPLLARKVAAQVIKALGVRPVKPETAISLGDPQSLYLNATAAREHYKTEEI